MNIQEASSYFSSLVLWKNSKTSYWLIPLIYLQGISSFTYKRIPPPFTAWLRPQGSENPLMINCDSKVVVQGCSVRKDVLRNVAKLTGNHLCQSLFLIKLKAKAKAWLLLDFPVSFYCIDDRCSQHFHGIISVRIRGKKY